MTAPSLEIYFGANLITSVRVHSVLGRDSFSGVHEDARFLSPQQFRLTPDETSVTWTIEAVNEATNETIVDGTPLRGSRQVTDGMTVAVGRSAKGIVKFPLTLRVKADASPTQRAAPALPLEDTPAPAPPFHAPSTPVAHEAGQAPLATLAGRLSGNKLALFALAGFLGGALGSLPNELWYDGRTSTAQISAVVTLAIYGLLPSAGITVMIALAQHLHLRKPIDGNKLRRVALQGAAAGAIAFALAQFLYGFELWGHQGFKHTVVRMTVWGVEGGILGFAITRIVPGLSRQQAAVGGLLGGIVGCALFLSLGEFGAASWLMRFIGYGVLGCGIGIALALVERIARRASVEVLWTPGQTSTITLGSEPITLGGGQDDLFIRGLAAGFATLTRTEDHVDYRESTSGHTTTLCDGSRIRPGGIVELLIHLR